MNFRADLRRTMTEAEAFHSHTKKNKEHHSFTLLFFHFHLHLPLFPIKYKTVHSVTVAAAILQIFQINHVNKARDIDWSTGFTGSL